MKINSLNKTFITCLCLLSKMNNLHVKASANESQNEYTVFSLITKNYNAKIRPTNVVDITLSLSLKQLVSIDEKNQIMTSSSTLALFWIDSRLSWDKNAFNGVDEIIIPTSSVWMQDLYVINSADMNGYVSMPSQSLALVQYTGEIYTVFSLTNLRTRCTINIKTYPFDTQECNVWFLIVKNVIKQKVFI